MTNGRVVSCCSWAFDAPVNETLVRRAEIGLAAVDLRPSTLRAEAGPLSCNPSLSCNPRDTFSREREWQDDNPLSKE